MERMNCVLQNAKWSASFTPTLSDVSGLYPHVPQHMHEAMFKPPPKRTPFEHAAGRPMVYTLHGASDNSNPFAASFSDLANLFDQLIPDATKDPTTREGYWASWRSFLTFLFCHGMISQALPASKQALQAFLMQLIMCGYSAVSIAKFITAIKDRHQRFNFAIPVHARQLGEWTHALVHQLGMPKKQKWTVLACHVRKVLELPRTSISRIRNMCIMALGTVCALRPSEVMRLQPCDLVWDIDGPGTLALLLWVRKNDGNKQGLWPRICQGKLPETCILILLKLYLKVSGIAVHPECTKKTWNRSPCSKCGSLFRRTDRAGKIVRPTERSDHGITRDCISKALRELLEEIGVESLLYTPVSMRRGGISTALSAGIEEGLRKLQSGHMSAVWSDYADVTNRSQLYLFCKAFDT